MNIPEPTFLPVDANTDVLNTDDLMVIYQSFEDEMNILENDPASRLRYLAMMVKKFRLDSDAIAELLESEASEMDRQIVATNCPVDASAFEFEDCGDSIPEIFRSKVIGCCCADCQA